MARAAEQSAVETDGRSRQNSAYRFGRIIKLKIAARFVRADQNVYKVRPRWRTLLRLRDKMV